MGRGTQAPLEGQTRPPPQARARGPQPGAPQACTGAGIAPEHKAPELASGGSRLRPAPTLPQPGGASPEAVAEAGEAARPAPRRALRPRAPATRPRAGAFVVRHNYADRRCLGRSLALPPTTRPAAGSSHAHPCPGCRPRLGQPSPRRGQQGPDVLPARGPAVSGAPEPGPATPGRSAGTGYPTAPPRNVLNSGEGTRLLSLSGVQAPSGGPRLGRAPPPTPSESRGRSDGPGPNRRPGSHSRRPAPDLAGACRSSRQPASPGARPGGGEAGSCSPRSARPAPSRSLTCQLSSRVWQLPPAPSSSPPGPGLAPGLPKDWAQAPELLELGVRKPRPPRRERRSRGRLGCGGGSGASLRCGSANGAAHGVATEEVPVPCADHRAAGLPCGHRRLRALPLQLNARNANARRGAVTAGSSRSSSTLPRCAGGGPTLRERHRHNALTGGRR